MSLEKLLRDRKIEPIKTDRILVTKTFNLALRDVKTAKRNLENNDYDWALVIAYNSMLQVGRALMFSKGYRPAGEYRHVGVVGFVHEVFGKEMSDRMIDVFNRARKKRHRVVYEEADIVSMDEAKNAVKFAEEFIERVKTILKL